MQVTVDGFQLIHVHSGLAGVTRGFLRSWCEAGHGPRLRVLVPAGFDAAPLRAEGIDCAFVPLPFSLRWGYSLGRVLWGFRAAQWLRRHAGGAAHYVPHFQNYGPLRRNVVLAPDLHWRIAPDTDARDRLYNWWSARGVWRPLVHRYEERCVARARRLQVLSRFVGGETVRWLGVAPDRVAYVPPGPPRWVAEAYDPARDAATAAAFRLPGRFVLYLGRFEPRKNVGLLLRACGEAVRAEPSFRAVVVGLAEPSALARFEVREAMADPAVQQAVVALPTVPAAALASLLRLSEFTVYPSLSEGFGLPVLEAAAAGRLCLCGDNSSLRELQPDASCRIPAADRAAWVARLLAHWRDPAKNRAGGQAASALLAAYSWPRSAATLWETIAPATR